MSEEKKEIVSEENKEIVSEEKIEKNWNELTAEEKKQSQHTRPKGERIILNGSIPDDTESNALTLTPNDVGTLNNPAHLNSSGFRHYILGYTGISTFISNFRDIGGVFDDPSNYLACIAQLSFLPLKQPSATSMSAIYVGGKRVDVHSDCGILAGSVWEGANSVNCTPISITASGYSFRGNYLDYKDTHELYLPYVGNIQIPTQQVVAMYRKANSCAVCIVCTCDKVLGDITYSVWLTKSTHLNEGVFIGSYSGNCASQYPMLGDDKGTRNIKAVGGITQALSGVATMAVGAMSENPVMAVGGAMSGIKGAMTFAESNAQGFTRNGSFTGNSSRCLGITQYVLQSHKVTDATGAYNGFSYGKPVYKRIGSTSVGSVSSVYNVLINGVGNHNYYKASSVELDTRANAQEKDEIIKMLNGGVYTSE